MSSVATKERILDVAERLFATNGLDRTSLREITREADVNLAAVNYHFGSKERLIEAAFVHRVLPINRERLKRLEAYEASANGGALVLEEVLSAYIRPVFAAQDGSQAQRDTLFLMLIGRLYSDLDQPMRTTFLREFEPVLRRYERAIKRALPAINESELLWCVHFLVGTLAHTLLGSQHLFTYTEGRCNPADTEALIARLIRYTAAGMRAAATTAATTPAQD